MRHLDSHASFDRVTMDGDVPSQFVIIRVQSPDRKIHQCKKKTGKDFCATNVRKYVATRSMLVRFLHYDEERAIKKR